MPKEKKNAPQNKEEMVRLEDLVAVYDELDELADEHPELAEKYGRYRPKSGPIVRFIDGIFEFREKHTHFYPVKYKTYCWLCLLGMFGVHHFYAKHWVKGLVYLALCWTGISIAMTIVDWMIAVPKKPDENGMILI